MEEFLRRGERHEAAGLQERDAGGKQQSFANIVSDEDDGFFEAVNESEEFALEFRASDRIEGAKWLVHEQDGGIGRQRACDANALALPTREFAGHAMGEFRRIEANETEQLLDAGGNAAGRPFFQGRYEADIFRDVEMRKKPCILNDVADAPAKANGVKFGSGTAVNQDLPPGRS